MLRFLGLLVVLPGVAWGQVRSVSFVQPARDFGISLGDVLVTEAVISVDAGAVLDRTSLPVAGAVSGTLNLRGVAVREAVADGVRQVRIRSEYQTFFAPEHVTQSDLPGYVVMFSEGGRKVAAQVPVWRFWISPFRLDSVVVTDVAAVRADHAVGLRATGADWIRLVAAGVLAIVAGLGLAGGRGWLPGVRRRQRPFAGAAGRIGVLMRRGAGQEAAILELHRAFDAAAGRRVLMEDLDGFLKVHPRFAGMRGEIERFFAVSRVMFFGVGDAGELELRGLSRRLRRAERAW